MRNLTDDEMKLASGGNFNSFSPDLNYGVARSLIDSISSNFHEISDTPSLLSNVQSSVSSTDHSKAYRLTMDGLLQTTSNKMPTPSINNPIPPVNTILTPSGRNDFRPRNASFKSRFINR